ncbi:hypothetical protein G6O69_13375 [Pseudenhygromyxa sp. WMMC2535]|uniref:hypothetical protein n=1 Tax=Pseudenhygromyxa sp. WMMC2535 TaxID=2712867 RepID=UPI001554F06E|nr:hypothetical protein [Pseudenhygromyxa sp. WMMC2535]NVB38826.1 hypothetical protein [Pseudenhygromyxa sp. WMMC2535]
MSGPRHADLIALEQQRLALGLEDRVGLKILADEELAQRLDGLAALALAPGAGQRRVRSLTSA